MNQLTGRCCECWFECALHGRMNYKDNEPICGLFCKIDLLTDFAALCLRDFIDWRYIHSWLVFSTQLVNCCPHVQRNYTCVLLFPLYLLSDLSPPPSQTKCTVPLQTVLGCGGGVGGVELCCRPYSAGVLNSVSDQIQKLQNYFTTPNKNDQQRRHLGIGVFKVPSSIHSALLCLYV